MVFVGATPSAGNRKTYEHAYRSILAARRRSPSTSAASVVLLVAPDVDALCAARMLSMLFRQDDVSYRIIPVSGFTGLQEVSYELVEHAGLCAIIIVNIGSMLDLQASEWFEGLDPHISIHLIDSSRPQSLANLFDEGPHSQRIVVWDDGTANSLEKQKDAYLRFTQLSSKYGGGDEEDDDSGRSDSSEEDEGSVSERSENERDADASPRPRRARTERREKREMYRKNRYNQKHYNGGIWHGQSASGIVYVLATLLERADNDLLWLSILGLTYQLVTSRISLDRYLGYHGIFHNEVARLNPPLDSQTSTSHPDDYTIRPCEELRFTMYRHWNLYDSMYHSSYVASKLGIWQDSGRKRLSGLLAKMGFSLQQCQQTYTHMDMDLKRKLREQIDIIGPEYGLHDLVYPGFIRSYGFKSQPLSAADVVESVSALLQAANGVQVQVESLDGQGGGEWFSGTRLWDLVRDSKPRRSDTLTAESPTAPNPAVESESEGADGSNSTMSRWWVKNFWVAFDALGSDLSLIQEALPLAMSLQRAVTRQGSSLVDKHAIRTFATFRLAVIKEGPDLPIFGEPARLARLGRWLADALRERQRNSRKGEGKVLLPLVIACLLEKVGTFLVVGITPSTDVGDVRKNRFGAAFVEASEDTNSKLGHVGVDMSIVQVNKDAFVDFMEALQITN